MRPGSRHEEHRKEAMLLDDLLSHALDVGSRIQFLVQDGVFAQFGQDIAQRIGQEVVAHPVRLRSYNAIQGNLWEGYARIQEYAWKFEPYLHFRFSLAKSSDHPGCRLLHEGSN